jgi:hypothetical protein
MPGAAMIVAAIHSDDRSVPARVSGVWRVTLEDILGFTRLFV